MAFPRWPVALAAVAATACSHAARPLGPDEEWADDEPAPAALVDAAVVDAPVDAEIDAPPADAQVVRSGPPEWDWWSVRRTGGDWLPASCKDHCKTWRVAAKVILVKHEQGKTVVKLDLGTRDGVTKSMVGRLIDDDGWPVGGTFRISLGTTRSIAILDATILVAVRQMLLFDQAVRRMPPDPPSRPNAP